MSIKKLGLVSYDYDELKSDFIEFIKSYNNEFSDIDYEGSNISLINNILSRNTQLIGYAANMLASESLWSTTNLRKNLVAQSAQLSYLPKSKTASTALIDITVNPATTPTRTNIISDRGINFASAVNDTTVYFSTLDNFTLSIINGKYIANDIKIYEGQFSEIKKVHNRLSPFIIEDTNIDISTLRVFIDNSNSDISDTEYVRATKIRDISDNSFTYYLTMNQDEQYEIRFGQDIFGQEPAQDSIIKIYYISVSTITNNASKFVCVDSISGYSDISVVTKEISFGGDIEESIESIRFLAPLAYQTQERVVNGNDAISILKEKFTFIKSGRSWGGETANPPMFGSIIVSVLTSDNSTLSPYMKEQMIEYLDEYTIGSITPVIVDPNFININPTLSIFYNNNISTKTFSSVRSNVTEIINSYNNEITDFNKFFNSSELISRIKNIDEVISVNIENSLSIDVEVSKSQNFLYKINFYNPITSILIENIVVDSTAEMQYVYDSNSKLYYKKIINGIDNIREIGTINYDTGELLFELNNISNTQFIVNAKTNKQNIYYKLNTIVTIKNINIVEVKQ